MTWDNWERGVILVENILLYFVVAITLLSLAIVFACTCYKFLSSRSTEKPDEEMETSSQLEDPSNRDEERHPLEERRSGAPYLLDPLPKRSAPPTRGTLNSSIILMESGPRSSHLLLMEGSLRSTTRFSAGPVRSSLMEERLPIRTPLASRG